MSRYLEEAPYKINVLLHYITNIIDVVVINVGLNDIQGDQFYS